MPRDLVQFQAQLNLWKIYFVFLIVWVFYQIGMSTVELQSGAKNEAKVESWTSSRLLSIDIYFEVYLFFKTVYRINIFKPVILNFFDGIIQWTL